MILEIEINDDEHPEVFATVLTPGAYSGLTGWARYEDAALSKLRKLLESAARGVERA